MAAAKKQKPIKKKVLPAKKGPGAPSKYKPEFVEQARKLCILGMIDDEIATFFEVNVDTIHTWKKKYPEFAEGLKAGKLIPDMEIAEKLYRRASGYDVVEQVAMKVRNATGKGEFTEDVKVVQVIRHIPADVTAQIFYLKNRQKGKWRDRHEIDANIRKDDWGNLEMEF